MLMAKINKAAKEPGHQTNPPAACNATETLWHVAETDNPSQVEPLLLQGADINAGNENGITALMRAASDGRLGMVRILLQHGADPNLSRNDKFSPLLLAAFFGHEEVVRLLIEHGADRQAASGSDTSAQMWASRRMFQEVVDYLKYEVTPTDLRNEPVRKQSSSPAPAAEQITQKTVDDISSTTSSITAESSVKAEQDFEAEPMTSASAVESPNEQAKRQRLFEILFLRPRFLSRFLNSDERRVAYSLGALLFVVALMGGWAFLKERVGEVSSKPKPTLAVSEIHVRTNANQNLSQPRTPNSQLGSLGSSDQNDSSKTPEQVTGGSKPKSPDDVHRSVASTTDSRRVKASQVEGQVTIPIATDDPKVVRAPELPSVATAADPKVSDAKPQPVSRSAIQRSAPASQSTQLMSPSKSSPPQGRTILWP